MYIRVFDPVEKAYYKSLVYALINESRQYIVLNPRRNAFELIDFFDKSATPVKPLVEIIQSDISDLTYYPASALPEYRRYCEKRGIEFKKLSSITGYPDICENNAFLAEILSNRSVPVGSYAITIRELKDRAEWNYIFTQGDANNFMEKFIGFHDSTLDTIHYSETDDIATANVIFDNSAWFGVVELCFEGVQMMKLIPNTSHFLVRDICEASLLIEDESVFWADCYMKKQDCSYEGNIIKAFSVKWRKIQ